jgi:hypothetical protein
MGNIFSFESEENRLQRLEHERLLAIRRREEEEERIRLAQRHLAEEAERVRVTEQRRVQSLHIADASKKLIGDVDFCIRTNSNFDSRTPLTCRCSVRSIQLNAAVQNSLAALNNFCAVSLDRFIAKEIRFFNTDIASNTVGVNHLTPFQGSSTHRVFGEFKCRNCRRKWSSAASWVDKWQKCKGCEAKCYPFQQHVLDQREFGDNIVEEKRPHDVTRCEKCIELGRICLPHMYVDSRYV